MPDDLYPVRWAGSQAVVELLPEHIDVSNAGQIREELLEDLAGLAAAAVTAEPSRPSQDLLDTITTRLFGAGLSLQAAMNLPLGAARQSIAAAVSHLDDIIRQVRDMAFAASSDSTPQPVPAECQDVTLAAGTAADPDSRPGTATTTERRSLACGEVPSSCAPRGRMQQPGPVRRAGVVPTGSLAGPGPVPAQAVRASDGQPADGTAGLLPRLHLDELPGELQGPVLATRDRMNGLLEAVVAVGADLDLEAMLHTIVETAAGLADASYGALGMIGEGGSLAEFVPVGVDEAAIGRIDHWPEGKGLLGLLIRDPRPLRLADLSEYPGSAGFPPGHPPMRSFLGVPVGVRGQVFGNLYLTEKRGGGQFTTEDESVVSALAAAAGVAIENARLYEGSRRQQRWLRASGEITTRLLSGTDPAEVLAALTARALDMSGSDVAVVALPDADRTRLVIEYADGSGAEAARGLVLPAGQSLSGTVLETGLPQAVADFAADGRVAAPARAALGHIGPALVFPLGAAGNVRGVFTIGRMHGARPYSPDIAEVMASFAAQAGVALEMADRRRDRAAPRLPGPGPDRT